MSSTARWACSACHTQRAGYAKGQYLNAGPARIAQHMVTLDYCREFGVPIEMFGNKNADGYYYNEGVGALSGTPIRHRTAKADIYGYVSELLTKATDQGALDGQLTADDKERLLSFLRNFGSIGGRADGWRYTGSTRRGYEVDPGAGFQAGTPRLPPYALSDVLESGVGQYLSFEFGWDQAMLMFQPVGGMDRIAYLDLGTIWYPSYGYHGAKGVVAGYYHFGASADLYSSLTPAQRQARAVEQGVKIHGEKYRTELETAFSVAWRRTRYSEGGWVSWPSRTSGHYGRLLEPDGNVYFAGDHLSYYIAWQAGAFESARKVVTDLHARVLST